MSCPQCSALYCSECGTEEHGKAPCPAPKDMEKWLGKNAKNTKRCPNCGVAVSKNGGCNHMTCAASAGGCGYEFCWLCLGKFPRCDCNHFNEQSEGLAARMAAQDWGGGGGRRRGGGGGGGRQRQQRQHGHNWGIGNLLRGMGFPDGGF